MQAISVSLSATATAAMYLSPFHLIDPAVFDNGPDPRELKRALGLEKRKLLAEFELEGSPSIRYRGRDIHRQELMQLFDELQDPASLQLHLQIWRSPSFLNFLETGAADPGASWLHREESAPGDADRRRISRFYALAVNRYLQACLRSPATPHQELRRLSHDSWLLAGDEDAAFRGTIRFYLDKHSELLRIRHRSESGGEVYMNHLYEWCSEGQLELLNELPRYFEDIRYRLADRLNDLCVYFDQLGQARTALAAIQRVAMIQVDDEELCRLIPSNLRLLQEETRVYSPPKPFPTPESGEQKQMRTLYYVLAGFVVLWLLTRVVEWLS